MIILIKDKNNRELARGDISDTTWILVDGSFRNRDIIYITPTRTGTSCYFELIDDEHRTLVMGPLLPNKYIGNDVKISFGSGRISIDLEEPPRETRDQIRQRLITAGF